MSQQVKVSSSLMGTHSSRPSFPVPLLISRVGHETETGTGLAKAPTSEVGTTCGYQEGQGEIFPRAHIPGQQRHQRDSPALLPSATAPPGRGATHLSPQSCRSWNPQHVSISPVSLSVASSGLGPVWSSLWLPKTQEHPSVFPETCFQPLSGPRGHFQGCAPAPESLWLVYFQEMPQTSFPTG